MMFRHMYIFFFFFFLNIVNLHILKTLSETAHITQSSITFKKP